MKYAVALHGGLGDLLLGYLRAGAECGYLPRLKEAEPDAFVRLAVMSTAPAAAELFSECRLFDEVVYEAWDGDFAAFRARTTGGFAGVEQPVGEWQPLGSWRRPSIGLTAIEHLVAAAIVEAGPFVALHPFAGTDDRDWRGKPLDLRRVIDALIDAGERVVLLGGSSTRTEGRRGTVRTVERPEALRYIRTGLVDLVSKGSVRLQAYLACRAACFIGAFSAYHCAALAMDVPAYVLAGAELEGFFATPHPVYGVLNARPRARFDYFERLPADLEKRMVEFAGAQRNV